MGQETVVGGSILIVRRRIRCNYVPGISSQVWESIIRQKTEFVRTRDRL